MRHRKSYKCRTNVSFAKKLDFFCGYATIGAEEEYVSWLSKVINECNRISNYNISFYVGAKILRNVWNLIPNARLVVIHRKAIGSYDKNYFFMYFGFLVTKTPIKRSYDLWNDVRLCSEGYFCRELRYPHPARTSNEFTEKIINL